MILVITRVLLTISLLILVNVIILPICDARVISSSVEYFVENNSREELEKVALESAKREALEQAGVYTLSRTLVKHNTIQYDSIKAITLGITKLIPDSVQTVYKKENGKEKLQLTAQFNIDEKEVKENLEQIGKKEHLLKRFLEEMDKYTNLLLHYNYLKAVDSINQEQDKYLLTEEDKSIFKNYLVNESVDGLKLCVAYANTALKEGQYKRAREIYQMIFNYWKNLPYRNNYLFTFLCDKIASTYIAMKDYDKADEYLERAIIYDESYTDALKQKIFLLNDIEAPIDEKVKYIKILEKYDLISANIMLGDIFSKQMEYDKAISYINRAIDYEKSHPLTNTNERLSVMYQNRGGVYMRQGYIKKAILDYEKSINLDSNNIETFNNLGCLYEETMEYDLALNAFSKVINADYSNCEKHDFGYNIKALGYFNRGNIYFHKEDYKKALSDYNMAIKLDPNIDNLWAMKLKAEEMVKNK